MAETRAQTEPAPAIAKPQRFHGFDALRGGAMLLGIVLHAAITHMVRRMDGLLWPLVDQPRDYGFDVLFWWIHGWRIPLFFVMAGFFAAMLARRRGPGGFIKHRVLRILIPVAVASVTLLPLMYALWSWGWLIEGRVRWEEVYQADFDTPEFEDHFMGPAHLWFLNYLVVFSFVYWAILKLRKSKPEDDEPTLPKPAERCYKSALRPVVFALPTFGFLAVDPGFYLVYHHLVPLTAAAWGYELAQLCFQGYFFAVGVYLFRLHRDMDRLKRYTWGYLIAAHVVFVGVVLLIRASFAQLDAGQAIGLPTRLGLAAGVSLFCWLMIWGMTGLGLTVLAKPRAWVRWLSDSAYWVYLVHLPIVALLMIVMRHWAIGPWPRFVLICAVTGAATLASYQYAVRYTAIGRWLNGPRAKPGPDHKPGP
ncbi:MAG: acyltransferase family protein [Phycisphaeraceae bacterium]